MRGYVVGTVHWPRWYEITYLVIRKALICLPHLGVLAWLNLFGSENNYRHLQRKLGDSVEHTDKAEMSCDQKKIWKNWGEAEINAFQLIWEVQIPNHSPISGKKHISLLTVHSHPFPVYLGETSNLNSISCTK